LSGFGAKVDLERFVLIHLKNMTSFNKIFFRGLITLLPIAVTIYVVYSSVIILDGMLGSILRLVLPASIYFPGLGFILILVLIYSFGLLLNNFVMARILSSLEKQLAEVPFIKAIYSPLRDLMNLFSKKDNHQMGSVVLVRMGDSNARAMGLMTREKFDDLKINTQIVDDKIAVYFPLSYGLGGYTLLVPQSLVEKVDIPVETAMRLAITGWVHTDTPTTPNKGPQP
jgi:uncharacterized membrane protein